MNEKYERQMKKGVLDMLVLKLLKEDQKYGYQLIMEMKEKSGGTFSLKEGTLYPILYRLEEERYVESQWSGPEGKQLSRKYYRITGKGKEALGNMADAWKQIARGVEDIMGGSV